MTLITIEDNQTHKQAPSLADLPLLRLGFRPFYLLAAAFAAVSVPVWLAKLYGWSAGLARVDLNWHVHEMVFGFAIAVIIGFLYTAGRNWTGLWTPRRQALAAIAGVWIAGRIAMLAADPWLAAVIDLSFLPVATWPLYSVLKRAGNRRNMFLIVLLSLLTAANALFHAARLGLVDMSSIQPMHAAILIIVIIESVIGGRIIPNFTANAVKGARPVTDERRDRIGLALTAGAGVAWTFGFPAPLAAAFAIAAAVTQITRLIGWQPFCTVRNPLLWILHLSYAWIPLGFMLLGLASLGLVTSSAAFHVLAVGSMAGLIIGMITRTALGHTGRQLKAGAAETAMYALMQIGVIARFAATFTPGRMRDVTLVIAAASWAAAFITYLWVYGPYLCKARLDGREG